MIKILLSSMGEGNPTEIEISDGGEKISDAVNRALAPLKLDRSPEKVFQVLVNGQKVEPEFWPIYSISKEDRVLIAPILGSTDQSKTASLFRTVAFIAAASVIGPWAAGLGYGAIAGGLIGAGVTALAAAAINSLIPAPVSAQAAVGASAADLSGSQMYVITGQSNQIKKMSYVPKVYGTHKMFPNVAANPYIELVAQQNDDGSVTLAQYFYCIYDFGLGPAIIEDIRIGDTPITQFTDCAYELVDLNKPNTPEGFWDNSLKNSFTYYKGDLETDTTSVGLNQNQPSAGSEAIRNSAVNADGVSQEIILSFICPNGLYGVTANGNIVERSIVLKIEFAPVGTDDWANFSDLSYVENFEFVGGDSDYIDTPIGFEIVAPNLVPFVGDFNSYDVLSESVTESFTISSYNAVSTTTVKRQQRGYDAGRYTLVLEATSAQAGDYLVWNKKIVGRIESVAPHSPGYYAYNLVEPLDTPLVFFTLTTTVVKDYSNTISTDYSITGATVNTFKKRTKNFSQAKITRSDTATAYTTVRFTPRAEGQFKVRVTRVSTSSESPTATAVDSLTWTEIGTRFDREPIKTDKRHVFLELRIKATDQLNGSVANLSGQVTSVLDYWNGSSWQKKPTNNPAWIFTDLLTGSVNKKAIAKSRLDVPSIYEWAQFCDQVPSAYPGVPPFSNPRFMCDFILDYAPTLMSALNQVTSAAQASLNMVDGKYGVLIDKNRTTPVQIFTPRNSRDFSSSRSYNDKPHALRMKYIDPSIDWQLAESIVYDDGYDIETATLIEDVQTFGVTNPEQAWRIGRYMLAVNRLRQESITITVDFENLVCTRGDYVQLTQDVMKVGGTPARVKSVSGNQIVVDEGLETVPGTYGYVYRSVNGSIYSGTITTIDSSDTFTLSGPNIPAKGDLVVIGIVGSIVMDCMVKTITPGDDLTATITLVEKAPGIYSAESGAPLGDYTPQISVVANSDAFPPSEVVDLAVVANTYEVVGRAYQYYISLDWEVPSGAAFENFEIYVNSGQGYNLYGVTKESFLKVIIDQNRLGITHYFKVLAVSATGKKLDLGTVGYVSATPEAKTTSPSNVAAFNIDITNETIQFFWEKVPDLDCEEYLIRYSPNVNASWEASIPFLRASSNATSASGQARTGVYFIKAVDFASNESEVATASITTIPNLFGLNVVDTISDFPALEGDMDRVEKNGDTLVLKKSVVGGVETTEYYSEGYYYYTNLLNLGEIYTVRLQSKIEAEGFTLEDLMSNWVTLDSVVAMSNSSFSEWDVETQYRGTDVLNTIDTWNPMSDVTQMSSGDEDNWSPWRKFTITDATAKYLQFRLKLVSNKPSVSPRVFIGEINADMPDRVESDNNIATTISSGYIVTYNPAFYGPSPTPAVQITLDNAQSGDYWTFDAKTLEGFVIRVYDKDNNQVSRIFDWQAKGYGRRALNII